MNKETILDLVKRLKESGQIRIPAGASGAWNPERTHNAQVDAAAAALIAAITEHSVEVQMLSSALISAKKVLKKYKDIPVDFQTK